MQACSMATPAHIGSQDRTTIPVPASPSWVASFLYVSPSQPIKSLSGVNALTLERTSKADNRCGTQGQAWDSRCPSKGILSILSLMCFPEGVLSPASRNRPGRWIRSGMASRD